MHKFETATGLAVSIAVDAVSKLAITLPVISEVESDLILAKCFHRVVVTLRAASNRLPGNRRVKGLFTVYVLIGSTGYPGFARLRVFEPDWTETRSFWQYDFQVSHAYASGGDEETLSVEVMDALHIVPLAEIRWNELPANLRDQVARWL